ncbi:Rieske 2Fe-2S domain-containing protein [Rhodococcus globerulus]|uniref:Rieske 2Fe-2S domain-containing protein n=1 Tax=Rhodococcus globerulus TaxID=33008 RepID=UPI00301B1051
MSALSDEVRQIEAQIPPSRFARGWHCLGLVRDFPEGEPHQVNAFGRKLVVFATQDGQIHVLDGYCRHMGGDLTQGTIKGDSIACPFHDWRWGGNGKCTGIPYARRVPPLARTQAWQTLVQDGMLFVWNDPEGNPPPAEAAIPRIEGYDDPDWTDWVWYTTTIEGTNCRELIDNIVDMAHFFYVHGSFPIYFKNIFEGHVASQFMNGVGRDDVARPRSANAAKSSEYTSAASYYGPSFMINEIRYLFEDSSEVSTVLINCHYPIDANSFVLQYGIMAKKPMELDDNEAQAMAMKMGNFVRLGFEQDVDIWRSKTRIDNPLLCEEDGPVYQLRRWYEQFYVDVADVTEEMVERFEFEIDTTKPNEAWRREVEENLTKHAASVGRSD